MVKWSITAPIRGEATCTVQLPEGSTKYDAYRAAFGGANIRWEETWEFNEDPRSGEYVTAYGPGCDGEEVDRDRARNSPQEDADSDAEDGDE